MRVLKTNGTSAVLSQTKVFRARKRKTREQNEVKTMRLKTKVLLKAKVNIR